MNDHPDPLPAQRLCNRYNNPNPIQGEGALGNQAAGRMYFQGPDQRDMVERVQRMLLELGYDLGSSGPGGDGVDGSFGPATDQAVRQFQEEHRGWDGTALKVDGLVGPRTADALNRQMVGRWYEHYLTPLALTENVPHHTVTVGFLRSGLSVEPGGAESPRVFVVGELPPAAGEAELIIRLVDVSGSPLTDHRYTLEIEDSAFEPVTGTTDDRGVLSHRIPARATNGRLRLESCIFNLSIISQLDPASTVRGAVIRLSNLGYLTCPAREEREQMTEPVRQALKQFQGKSNIEATGELDESTSNKLREAYGT
jgi:peptidoglycan hydrolase-like protein with peptidoglycan-binding domain